MISVRTCRDALINASALIALLLISVCAVAAAPDGQWWNADYPYRQQLSVDPGNSDLSAGYSTQLIFNHAAEVAANRSLANGDDVRIVRWNQSTSTWTELHRVLDSQSSWNNTSTTLWFANAALIEDDETSTDYYIYFGNAAPNAPLQDPEQVFLLFDAFSGSALDTNRWTSTGSPSVSAGVLTLPVNASIRSRDPFDTETVWEARISIPTALPNGGGHSYDLWLGMEGSDLDDAHIGFIADPGDYNALSRWWITLSEEMAVGNPASWNTYSFARAGGSTVRYQIGGGAEETINWWFAVSDGPMNAFARNNANGSRELRYDWVRIRRYRRIQPDIDLLGAREQYAAVGEWQMDESAWNGTANEVKDSRALGLHLASVQTSGSGANTEISSPARPGSPGTCRYGVFDGANDYLQRADHASLDVTSRLTMMAWIRPASYASSGNLKTILSKDNNYEIHLNSSGRVNWWWQSGGVTRELTSDVSVPLNQWSHVAATYVSGVQRIYINGVERVSSAFNGTLTTNSLPLQIGQDQGHAGRFWNGNIDEVRIYDRVLSKDEITAAMNAARPCLGGAAKLVVGHDNYGIHCMAELITVRVLDAANNQNTSFNGQVELAVRPDQGPARGVWSVQQGSGSLTNVTSDGGIARYQWPLGEHTARFWLMYKEGHAVVDIDASLTSNSTVTDDDSEGDLTFTQSGFTVTSAELTDVRTIPPFTPLQTAGRAFDIHITAYGQSRTDETCGVIESYHGQKEVQLWSEYVNPLSGGIQVDISGEDIEPDGGIGANEGDADSRSITFDSGKAVVSAKYKDTGKISINLKDVTSNPHLERGARGGTGELVFKPHTLQMSGIRTTGDPSVDNPSATSADGAKFIAAGAPFRATVTARDFEGTATPNFGKELPLQNVTLQTMLVSPTGMAGLQNPDIQTAGFQNYSSGSSTATDLKWAEVGIVSITPRVADYLSTGSEIIGTPTPNIGRFVPAYLHLETDTEPTLQPACVAGGFTYFGQPFEYFTEPVVRVTPMNLDNVPTRNYRGPFFKIKSSALPDNWRIYEEASGAEISGAPDKTVDPVIAEQLDGSALLTYGAGSATLLLERSLPRPPLDARITLKVNVKDEDEVLSPVTNYQVTADPASPEIEFLGASRNFRYGRIAMRNSLGSELLNLPTPLKAEYFESSAAGFMTSTSDVCTSNVDITFTSYAGELAANETCVLGSTGTCVAPLLNPVLPSPAASPGGDFGLVLRAPGQGNHGSVTLEADVPAWLKFDWDVATSGEENPSGIATFGVFQGSSRRIDQRERY